jgi:MFS family permease
MPQLFSVLGICIGYFICYGTVRLKSSMAWRIPFIIMAIVSAILAVSCYLLPPSPRLLILNGKKTEAIRAIETLGIHREEAEKDILRVREEDLAREEPNLWQSFKMIWARQYRSRTILALFIAGMVQLCGIDGILYYAPTLFAQAGLPEQTAGFLASGLSSVLIVVVSIPVAMFADKWGRRLWFITGGISLSGLMFLMGTLYAAQAVHSTGPGRWVVIISIFGFAMSYSATWAFVGKIYASEIQPSDTRAASNSVAQGLGYVSATQSLAFDRGMTCADEVAVHQWNRGTHHTYPPRRVCIRCLLPFRRTDTWHTHRIGSVYARDQGRATREHPGGLLAAAESARNQSSAAPVDGRSGRRW